MMGTKGKMAFAGPWIGELGWEIMTWQSHLRLKSRDYDRMFISSFPGMEALYQSFHCPVEFVPHKHGGRALDWRDTSMVKIDFDPSGYTEPVETIPPIKQYQTEGEYVRYGTPRQSEIEVLFHARGIQKASFKNYPIERWNDIAAAFPKAASIGTMEDYHIEGTEDRRGLPLQELMDLMASACVIVGQSSGVMHLASLCGTRQVVWADDKTYFGQPLEVRYKETWNPFHAPVSWVFSDNWCPEPDDVIKAIISGGETSRPTDNILGKLKHAVDSGRYLVALAYIGDTDGKETTETFIETVNFPIGNLEGAFNMIQENMKEILPEKQPEEVGVWR